MMITNKNSHKSTAVKILCSCLVILLCSFNVKNNHESRCKENPPNEIPAQALTLQYSNSTFKAGSVGFSEARASMSGGIFSCQRLSSNQGDLSINRRTGRIDQQNSDVGEYVVTYTINHKSVTANIIVLNNNLSQ